MRGRNLFVADIKLPGMLHVAFARSPMAHGRIVSSTHQKPKAPGVVAVFSGSDTEELPIFRMQTALKSGGRRAA